MNPEPKLTIGIPAYNEEEWITECLESCISQNARVLVSNNGSTDRTNQMAERFSRTHGHVHILSHTTNRGSLWNFQHLLEKCETEYFMWLGAHDKLHGDFGGLSTQVLAKNPWAAFCAPRFHYIMETGAEDVEKINWDPIISDPRPFQRLDNFLRVVHRFTLIHSVFRTQSLKQAWRTVFPNGSKVPGPDILLMAWILVRFQGLSEPRLCYIRRIKEITDPKAYYQKIYPTATGKPPSPKEIGSLLIRFASQSPFLTWMEKRKVIYSVVQKWGRPRGNHPVQLAIYLFSEGKKKIGPLGRRLNNRLFGISGKPRTSKIQAPRVLSRKDVIEKFSRPNLPVAFGKIGTTELLAMEYHYRRVKTPWGWNRPAKRLYFDSGVFPPSLQEMNQFVSIYREAISQMDGLYLWQPPGFLADFERELVQSINPKAERIKGQEVSFSLILELPPCRWVVVSSFAGTMLSQLQKLPLLHPRFTVAREVIESCQFVQAPHFPWHKPSSRASWSEELNRLKEEVLSKEFDVAIIGAGAYSLPLLAAVKSSGRKGIHLGGEIQLLFGIKGRRWDAKNLYNDHWVRPSPDETPSNFMKKENGCYW